MTEEEEEQNLNTEQDDLSSQEGSQLEKPQEEPIVDEPLNPLNPANFNSSYFFFKHTDSFKCFEQFLCSQSDLGITINFFPPLTDPGLDDAFNYIAPEEEPDFIGGEKYKKLCKDFEIVPISRILKSLTTETLDLKYYGLTLKQMRALAEALKVNSNVKHLILQDNWMSPEATVFISDIMRENMAIKTLNLQECRIGPEGAEKLNEGLSMGQFLQELDLSFNDLGDVGLKTIQASLIYNTSLKKLDISHNNLTEDSGETLEVILRENKNLEDLNLAWNGFFTGPGNKKMFNGLQTNQTLKRLDLSWNGIGTGPAMMPLTKYMKKTETLEYLNLSHNRITKRPLKLVRVALLKSKSLIEADLGFNICTPDEVYFLGSLLLTAQNSLKCLKMDDMCVNKDFVPVANRIKRMGKRVTHGRVLSNYEIYGPDVRKLLFKRCKFLALKPKKKKMKKDFGHFVLSLPDKPVTADEFKTLMKKKKVKKIDKDLLNELLKNFQGKRQKVDCETMKNVYMTHYPDTVLPEEKQKKKKGKGKKKKKKQKA